MTTFKTLVWLEYRRSRVWAAALIGSLALWAWGIHQVAPLEVGTQLLFRLSILAMAALIGGLILCLMIGRVRAETRHGQYQVLLLTPPSGYIHMLARFVFAVAVAIIYYMMVAGLCWWILAQAGVGLDAGNVIELLLAVPLYGIGVVITPALAWTLLLMIFISAYRISGGGWIPGTVMVLGTSFALRWYLRLVIDISYSLPSWRLLEDVSNQMTDIINQTAAHTEIIIASQLPQAGLPQEPLWGMLLVTVLLLALAGRIWQEVEA